MSKLRSYIKTFTLWELWQGLSVTFFNFFPAGRDDSTTRKKKRRNHHGFVACMRIASLSEWRRALHCVQVV